MHSITSKMCAALPPAPKQTKSSFSALTAEITLVPTIPFQVKRLLVQTVALLAVATRTATAVMGQTNGAAQT